MLKSIKKYIWLFEWISAALILALGLVVGFVDGVVLLATGISLILIGVLRIVPLFKTLKDKMMKVINFFEILFNVIAGALMIILTVNAWNNDTELVLGEIFGYLLGFILFVRGVVFFIGTSFKHEHTDVAKFIAHIVFISLGVWFVSRPTDEKTLGMFVLIIAILCCLFIVFDGIKNYRKYRYEYASIATTKKIVKEENLKEAPKAETEKNDDINEPTNDVETITEPISDETHLNA